MELLQELFTSTQDVLDAVIPYYFQGVITGALLGAVVIKIHNGTCHFIQKVFQHD